MDGSMHTHNHGSIACRIWTATINANLRTLCGRFLFAQQAGPTASLKSDTYGSRGAFAVINEAQDGDAAWLAHRRGGLRVGDSPSAQTDTGRPRRSLSTDEILAARDPRHVSGIQNGNYVPDGFYLFKNKNKPCINNVCLFRTSLFPRTGMSRRCRPRRLF